MSLTDLLVLPADVAIVRASALPGALSGPANDTSGEFAIGRRRSRSQALLIDAKAAALLEHFREPTTVAEAVLRASVASGVSAERLLEEIYPLLKKLVSARMLSPRAEAGATLPELQPGDMIAGGVVMSTVRVMEDAELHRVFGPWGHGALKLARNADGVAVIARETRAYERLAAIAPKRIAHGVDDGRPWLVLAWFEGASIERAAELSRELGDRAALLDLVARLLNVYAELHEAGVLHGDVHPGNVLVDADHEVRLVDFGFARFHDDAPEAKAPRAGVAFYNEPEYARAALARERRPEPSERGEQHAIAALAYRLITGAYYLDFPLDERGLLEAIATHAPLPFARHGARWAHSVERVLARALAKDPAERFASTRELATAFAHAAKDARLTTARASKHDPLGEAAAAFEANLLPGGELDEKGIDRAPWSSVNLGAAGIAYALLRLACAREDPAPLAWSDVWLRRAEMRAAEDEAFVVERLSIGPERVAASAHHGPIGVACVRALVATAQGDALGARRAAKVIASGLRARSPEIDLSFGTASALLAAAIAADADPALGLGDAGDEACARLVASMAAEPTIVESSIRFGGVAHGWGGLLYAILRWSKARGRVAPIGVRDRVDELASHAEPVGRGVRFRRLLTNDPAAARDSMAGWCNGSAGLALVFLESGDVDLAERCAWHAFESSEPHADLCCGASGRAYALLAMARATSDARWIDRARLLAERAIAYRGEYVAPDSLYRGKIGVGLLACDLANPDAASMPFF